MRSADEIIRATAEEHGVDPADYVGFRSMSAGREMAALLCRRWTGESLSSLSSRFGLSHLESSANLVRRAKAREQASKAFRAKLERVEQRVSLKTENQV